MTNLTLMESETQESASIIENQLKSNLDIFADIVKRLKKDPPPFIGTIARGSSDHAAAFAKYAFETHVGILTATISPSIHTLYKSKLNYKNSLIISISQSGKSEDLIESLSYARKHGAVTLSFVNEEHSPLAKESEYNIPLLAGKENSVAATKSYIASLSRIIQFIAEWTFHGELKQYLHDLPIILNTKKDVSLSSAIDILKGEQNVLVLGRGFGFPIALESALKLKETCGLHAEAFSGAEILHGPFELIQKNCPVIIYLQKDATYSSMLKLIEKIDEKNAQMILIGAQNILNLDDLKLKKNPILIPTQNSVHPLCDCISLINTFYPFAAKLALSKGRNPDKPENLNKVTSTV
ncbi:SIS domain-containing protein [Fluviispira multicolorata]|uniref:SIS domain-containing protein n=1 Tax=Fluviispira multicolorata TaxID=2654512 RepID=A0A833JDJ2_9BACT|nr:SIS domain-containing protein [Fluviispira multicolorata]KAB8031925.1 SIS domain-containing protein [Fluviispira multicolorata]